MLEAAREDRRRQSVAERRGGRWLAGLLAVPALFAFAMLVSASPRTPALAIATIVSGVLALALFALWRRVPTPG
jgi:hypothetical protein